MKLGACLGWGDFSKYEFAKKCGLDYGETDFTDIALASEEDFNELCEYIKKNGHFEYFFNHRGVYCVIGEYTYWIDDNVINRRWNDMYYLNERKQI